MVWKGADTLQFKCWYTAIFKKDDIVNLTSEDDKLDIDKLEKPQVA